MYAEFDIETNRAGLSNSVFFCDRLFQFVGADSSRCSWLSNQFISIILGPKSLRSLEIGSVFTLKNQVLFADEAIVSATPALSIKYNKEMSVSISEPYDPITPFITLTSPAQVFVCDGISLDPTGKIIITIILIVMIIIIIIIIIMRLLSITIRNNTY